LAKGLIVAKIAKNVVLVTAEMYSKHIHPFGQRELKHFGDAAATLISSDGHYQLVNFH
jgi:3-oxoacyl-[acyl-carrier-protein] synthase-3